LNGAGRICGSFSPTGSERFYCALQQKRNLNSFGEEVFEMLTDGRSL
jgi:hypothetical protein